MGIEPTLVAWEGPSPAQSNSLPPLTSRQIFEPPDRRDPTWGWQAPRYDDHRTCDGAIVALL